MTGNFMIVGRKVKYSQIMTCNFIIHHLVCLTHCVNLLHGLNNTERAALFIYTCAAFFLRLVRRRLHISIAEAKTMIPSARTPPPAIASGISLWRPNRSNSSTMIMIIPTPIIKTPGSVKWNHYWICIIIKKAAYLYSYMHRYS